jgi:branched-subunit amino acid aminotransferase/4-amino-4-deoxychorismate lyase
VLDRVPAGRAVRDGEPVDASALALDWADPAAQWGLGVFETVAVRGSSAAHLAMHHERLDASAARARVAIPERGAIERACADVAGGVAGGYGWLKVCVSRSGRWAVFGGVSDPADEGRPTAAVVLPWRRHHDDVLAGMKTLAYAAAILGLEEARRRGADDGLWLNERGHVIGACTSNVFVVRGRAAVTPSRSDGAREGVTRERAIAALRADGIAVRISKVRMLTLRGADEVFVTSSLGGVRPIVRIDGRDVRGGAVGPVTRRVAQRLTAATSLSVGAHGGRARE